MYKRLLSLTIAMFLLGLSVFAFPVTAIEESTANDDEVTDTVEQEENYTSYSESSTSSQVLENEQTTNTSGANESVRSTTSTIEDGVYAFHNIGNSTMWMDTQYDSDEVGYHMQQYAYTSSPVTTFSRGGLFKITSVANGRYVIRLMTNNLLTFELTSSGVFTKEIPANDEDVAAADTFFIESAGTGYYIRPYGSSYVVTANTSSSSGSSGAPNSYLTRVLKLSSTSTAKWDLIRYTDVHWYGYTIYKPTYWTDTGLIAGKETDASVTVWSTYPGVNTPYMSIATSSASYASFQWYEAESAIYITPHYEGILNLNIQIRESASSGPTHSFTKTYDIGLPIEEGLYYIKNAHNSKIMDIEGPSMSDGAYIQQYAFSASRQSKWRLEHFKDGYYYIQSNYSDKFVGADTSENSIKQYTSQLSDLRRWKFEETDNGNYKIINRSTQKVISASSAYIGDGVNLVHTAYTDDTDMKDEWILESADAITFYGITNTGHDHSSCLVTVKDSLLDADFNNVTLKTGAVSSSDCLYDLKNTSVFTSRSHGCLVLWQGTETAASTGILLNDEEGTGKVVLYSHSWSAMTSGSTSISATDSFVGLELVLFIGCETAYDDITGRNLPVIVASQGAEVAIGFSDTILCSPANEWTKDFYAHLLAGYTVQESVDYASDNQSDESGLRSAVVCGNGDYRIGE